MPDVENFARQYTALRREEGWIGPDGREDPRTGSPALWRGRLKLAMQAAAVIEKEWAGRARRAVIADVGSGGDWLGAYLPRARLVSIDLLPPASVRADMRRLPLRTASVDAVIFAASLHYARLEETIPEAARVLVPNGLFIALDSPVYADEPSRSRADERSTAYYRARGYPDLAAHYHPIEAGALRTALATAGLAIERFDVTRQGAGLRGWLRRGPPACLVFARRLR